MLTQLLSLFTIVWLTTRLMRAPKFRKDVTSPLCSAQIRPIVFLWIEKSAISEQEQCSKNNNIIDNTENVRTPCRVSILRSFYYFSESDLGHLQRLFGPPTGKRKPTKSLKNLRKLRTGATLDQVAGELGVSKERARQLEAQALKKCRRWCSARRYRMEYLLRG